MDWNGRDDDLWWLVAIHSLELKYDVLAAFPELAMMMTAEMFYSNFL